MKTTTRWMATVSIAAGTVGVLAALAGSLAGPLHRVGRILQPPRGLLHRGRALLARQPLQLPRQLLGLAREVLLRAASAASALVGQPAGELALALDLLLLAACQLTQALQRLVHLVVGLPLRAALDRLVLVLDRKSVV